jgi:DNA-binding winged helix-turn-helix (wHTH) protein
VEDGNLSVNVSMLRKALRGDVATRYIETLPRVGYRFSGDVFEHPPEPASADPHRPQSRVEAAPHVSTGSLWGLR